MDISKAYDLRAQVQSSGDHFHYRYVIFYDGDPEKDGRVISTQTIFGLQEGDSYIWTEWKPTELGEHKLYAYVVEHPDDSQPGNNRDFLIVNVADRKRNIELEKTQFIFYYNPPNLVDRDQVKVTGFMEIKSDEVFEMPFDKDVTVDILVKDPRNKNVNLTVFTDTISAGTTGSSTEGYHYNGKGSGIKKLLIKKVSGNKIKMDLFVDNVNFLPDLREEMTPGEYLAFIRDIEEHTVAIYIEGGNTYIGSAPLSPGKPSKKKQKLSFQKKTR